MSGTRLSVTGVRSYFDKGPICSFDWNLSDQNRPLLDGALTCRLKRFGSHSKWLVGLWFPSS